MATVFMKWLEQSPKNYDRGIQLLTLGRLQRIKEKIAVEYIEDHMRILEIGCGTGSLAVTLGRKAAHVSGIDSSPRMLVEAQKNVSAADLEAKVTLKHMDAVLIGERFPAASFDMIISTLVFSELSLEEQRYVLEASKKLLAPNGKLLIADEVVPKNLLARSIFFLIRLPLVFLTWLLTRTTTSALRDFESLLGQTGFREELAASYLGDTLVLFQIEPAKEAATESMASEMKIGTLRHLVTLRTLLLDLWLLFFRIIPPYPKVRPGLYKVGEPDMSSPALVTGNFDLTIRRLVKAIDRKINAWVLVADTAGINVWCAAGGGYFTAEKIIAAVQSSHLAQVVNHRTLILPQLCANGVEGGRLWKEIGWRVRWGPVRALDLPAYLTSGCEKTAAMRGVRFPLWDRLEMVTVTLGFYGLLILLPVLVFWRELFWPLFASLVGLSYSYAVLHPWLPGRDGLVKSIPLTILALAGLFFYNVVQGVMPAGQLFNWAVGLTALSVFTAAELQGMSPLMRGEQANWGWEIIIGAALGLCYWLVPQFLGWR
jgi:demethylmenaquinone methyltransferase/2-methoxy-6-polyprenyl-1,4-benzoquinol methylase